MVIGNWLMLFEYLYMNVLLEDEIVCLMLKDNLFVKFGRLIVESYIDVLYLVLLFYLSL